MERKILKRRNSARYCQSYPQYHESTISRHIQKMGISRGKGKIAKYQGIEQQIIQEYQQDKFATCTSLSEKYGINDRTISNWLKEHNVSIKQTSGYVSKANQEYFKTIDTPHKAYLLGFITADGAVTGKKIVQQVAVPLKQKNLIKI